MLLNVPRSTLEGREHLHHTPVLGLSELIPSGSGLGMTLGSSPKHIPCLRRLASTTSQLRRRDALALLKAAATHAYLRRRDQRAGSVGLRSLGETSLWGRCWPAQSPNPSSSTPKWWTTASSSNPTFSSVVVGERPVEGCLAAGRSGIDDSSGLQGSAHHPRPWAQGRGC